MRCLLDTHLAAGRTQFVCIDETGKELKPEQFRLVPLLTAAIAGDTWMIVSPSA